MSASATVTVGSPADTSPPSTPTGLSGSAVSASQINLSWSASTDNVAVTGYNIMRNGLNVGTSVGTTYADTGLSADTAYNYTVSAYDAAGNTSPASSPVSVTTQAGPSPPPPVDTAPPTVSITSPVNGASFVRSTIITITASASDNIGVTKVEFYVGTSLACAVTSGAYACNWKLPGAPNKSYNLSAKAYDAVGNTTTSSIVTITATK